MANIRQTVNIGTTAGTKPAQVEATTQDPARTRSELPVAEYRNLEATRPVADSAEVPPQEWLNKLSQKDYSRHKEALATLAKSLKKIGGNQAAEKGREKGFVKVTDQLLVELKGKWTQEKDPHKKGLLAQSIQELQQAVDEVKTLQETMETKLAQEGPMDISKARKELALQRLEKLYGEKIPPELAKDPAKLRELVTTRLQTKLSRLSEGKKKVGEAIRKQEALLKQATSEEQKSKLAKGLTELRAQLQRFNQGEQIFSQAVLSANNWVREFERGELEGEFQQESASTGPAESAEVQESHAAVAGTVQTESVGGGAGLVGISSVGGGAGGDEGDFEQGFSEYREVSRALGIASSGGIASTGDSGNLGILSPDLTGTNLAMIQSRGNAQQEIKRSKKILDQLMKRLLAGDLRALDLCLIMLARKASFSMVEIGAKMIKSLDALDRSQQEIIKQLDGLSIQDPSFSSKTSAANIAANRVAADRTSVINLMRDARTSQEEVENIAKSWLDIQGSQIRHLSRFNT